MSHDTVAVGAEGRANAEDQPDMSWEGQVGDHSVDSSHQCKAIRELGNHSHYHSTRMHRSLGQDRR